MQNLIPIMYFILICLTIYTSFIVFKGFYKEYLITNDKNKFELQSQRNKDWKKLRNYVVEKNKKCCVCGKTTNLVAHHKLPFHLYPEKELDEDNIIILCENRPVNCHYLFGHLMDWKKYNSNITEDIDIWSKRLEKTPKS
jgi:hypothetical protein